MRTGVNMEAVALAADSPVVLPLDGNRAYLCLIATGDTTVTFSNGVYFIVKAGHVWAPMPAAINAMTLSGAGTLLTG